MDIKIKSITSTPYINELLQTNDNWAYKDEQDENYGQITAEAFNNLISNTKIYRAKGATENYTTYITNYLQWLDRKIEAANRSYSMWDTYKIQNVSSNQGEIAILVANLGYNSSVICGVRDTLYLNNKLVTVYSGDIILRDSIGVFHLIPGASNGSWKPSPVEGSNQIVWTFDTSAESGGSVEMPVSYETQLTSGERTLASGDSYTIPELDTFPVIEAYIDDERAYNVYSISITNEQYTITNTSAYTITIYWK